MVAFLGDIRVDTPLIVTLVTLAAVEAAWAVLGQWAWPLHDVAPPFWVLGANILGWASHFQFAASRLYRLCLLDVLKHS